LDDVTMTEPDVSVCLCRRSSLGQSKVRLCSRIRIGGGEVIEVNGNGDRLLIDPPRNTIGLGKREILLLDRLHCIVSMLSARPDWRASEWKSVVNVALNECVEGYRLEIGPDLVED
jgi:hypothetical protein